MSIPLTTRIPIRDQRGNVVDEKEVATYAGLLARAHEEGLKSIATALVQIPTADNGLLAIVSAVVETSRGKFMGIGDASPENVGRKIAPHIVRMAETRAKARALRDAVNIGTVSLEELGDNDVDLEPDGATTERNNVRQLRPRRDASEGAPRQPTASDTERFTPMTEPQRRLLFRILAEHGHEGDQAIEVLVHAARVASPQDISKRQASELIDRWRASGVGRGA